MRQENTTSEAAALRSEHASLDGEIAAWRQWWRELSEMGDPHFGEMGDRLAHFREHLAGHFAHEESQGCLSLVIGLPPEAVKQMATLRDEHSSLMEELDRLVTGLHACDSEFDCWGKARQEFERFLDRLDTHESAEDSLLDRLPS